MHNDQEAWLEAMAEMVKGFRDHVGEEHIVYINVMNRLSVDCDCDGHPAEPSRCCRCGFRTACLLAAPQPL